MLKNVFLLVSTTSRPHPMIRIMLYSQEELDQYNMDRSDVAALKIPENVDPTMMDVTEKTKQSEDCSDMKSGKTNISNYSIYIIDGSSGKRVYVTRKRLCRSNN